MSDTEVWGSDVPISMPIPPSQELPGIIPVGDGFTMTMGGIGHAIDINGLEEYIHPTYAPMPPTDTKGVFDGAARPE